MNRKITSLPVATMNKEQSKDSNPGVFGSKAHFLYTVPDGNRAPYVP